MHSLIRCASVLVLTVAVVTACSTDDDTDDTNTVNLSMTCQEYGTASPLAGASVTAGGTTLTTDSAGAVTVALPVNATSVVGVTQPGFPDYTIYATMLDVDQVATYDLGSDASLDALSSAMMLSRDASKGLLSVGVRDGTPGDSVALAGAEISVDAARDAQVVFDSSSDSGFSLGDTTLEGSSSASVFVNIAPGTITPSIIPPSGYTCEAGPPRVEVVASGYTIVNYYCHP